MNSDILLRHKQLLKEEEATRIKLSQLEQAVLESEKKLGQVFRENPLLRHIGFDGIEKDLSDYIGSELDAERPSVGSDADAAILPKKPTVEINPAVTAVALEDPTERFFFSYPYLGLSDQVTLPKSASQAIKTRLKNTTIKSDAFVQEGSAFDLSFDPSLPEEPTRAALALKAAGIAIWDWNTLENSVHTSPYWELLMGETVNERTSPLESLLANIAEQDKDSLRIAVEMLSANKISRFCLCVRLREKDDAQTWVELHGCGLRNSANEMLRLVIAAKDVTQRQEAEIALRNEYEQLRAKIEGKPDIVFSIDISNRIQSISASIAHYLPVSLKNIVGSPLRDVFPKQDWTFLEEHIRTCFTKGTPVHAEITLVSPLIGEFKAEHKFFPETDQEGNIVRVTVQVLDLTKEYRVAENYHALFNTMEDGFLLLRVVSNKETTSKDFNSFSVMAVNPSVGRLLGKYPEQVMGKGLEALIEEEIDQWNQGLESVIRKGQPSIFHVRYQNKPTVFEVSAYIPGPERIACIIKDVTAIYSYEETIHLNEARFSALYRLSQMFAASEEELVRFALEQVVTLTGSKFGYFQIFTSPADNGKRGYWVGNSSMPQDEMEQMLKSYPGSELLFPQSARRGPSVVNAEEYVPISGWTTGITFSRYMTAPIMEDGNIVCIAVVGDKQKAYEASDLRQLVLFFHGLWFQMRRRWAVESLEKAKNAAEAANRQKTEFLANVSHELRTPLNGVLGMLQLLAMSNLTNEQKEWVDVAEYSGRSLLRLISDILDFSRIESGRYNVENKPFDLVGTLRSTLGIFIQQANMNCITFNLDVDASIPPVLLGDEVLVRQIILNVVGNAVKFTEKGSVTVECQLLPHSKDSTVNVYFAIRDTGIGIEEKDLQSLFLPFMQVDGSLTRRYSGVGLGLSIVQRLIKATGGTLCIDSEPGKGTTVHISLPFKKTEEALPVKEIQQGHSESSAPALTILFAEDDAINQLTIRRLLEKRGHTVFCVDNGKEAIAALRIKQFDCLITDIQMPVMDGEEVVCRIRSGRTADIAPTPELKEKLGLDDCPAPLFDVARDIPVIALTAHAMKGSDKHFQGIGMNHYLEKPINATKLYAVVDRVGFLLEAKN